MGFYCILDSCKLRIFYRENVLYYIPLNCFKAGRSCERSLVIKEFYMLRKFNILHSFGKIEICNSWFRVLRWRPVIKEGGFGRIANFKQQSNHSISFWGINKNCVNFMLYMKFQIIRNAIYCVFRRTMYVKGFGCILVRFAANISCQ